MFLPFFVARRYLFAKKSHNVINLIAYIGLGGVMLGAMALAIILSVFNGFENLTESLYDNFSPEIRIFSSEGKTFEKDSLLLVKLRSENYIENLSLILEDNVLISYQEQQALATMKGVDSSYLITSPLVNKLFSGNFVVVDDEDTPFAVLGYGVASKLGLYSLQNPYPISFYVPKRGRKLANNPTESSSMKNIYASGIFMVEQSFDEKYVFVPLDFASELLGYSNRLSAIEINLKHGSDLIDSEDQIKKLVGKRYNVQNRYEQNASLYKMMKAEKLAVYVILLFIILILTFNISGSLFMLILEKKMDIKTYQSMGASNKLIRNIFLLEGWLISLLGLIVGLLIGLIICYVQQQWGLLKVPGNNFIIDSYPVLIKFSDILLIILGVGGIGYLTSYLSVFYLKRIL